MQKTLAMKVLAGQGIDFEVLQYPASERDAVMIAGILNLPPAQLFKTLVVPRPNKKTILALIPANRQLNLKKLAKATGDKKLKMATHLEAEELTKLQVGGISPLALLNRGFVMWLDESAREFEMIYVSAGKKGINLKVPVAGIQTVLGAYWGNLGR